MKTLDTTDLSSYALALCITLVIPRLNELLKSVCERYDIAVTNREKVDEALQLFKKVLEVELGCARRTEEFTRPRRRSLSERDIHA